MYVRSLSLTNLKLLADQTFNFTEEDGSPRRWTVLLGDNGVCKTSILQSIAIAASGDRVARALLDDAAELADASNGNQRVEIRASFDLGDSVRDVGMHVQPGTHAFRGDAGSDFFNEVRDARKPGYLVIGYGIGRRLPRRGEVAVPQDPVTNRVEGLFDSHHKMLGVDFFEALREQDENLGLRYAETLGEVLSTADQDHKLFPWLVAFERRGQGGVNEMRKLLESRRLVIDVGREQPIKLAPHQLSQGYQSMFAWIADLLGHAFLDAGEPVSPAEMQGIVLLDEIDLHLHPTWQRRLVPLLRATFPKLQFVVTTHSPLVLTGFEAHEIIRLDLRDGEVVQTHFETEPAMKSGSALMESFFGVPTAGRPELVEVEQRLTLLLATPASPTRDAELGRLREQLRPYLESTDLADLPAIDDIDPDVEDEVDREVWRKQLLAAKKRAVPDFGEGEGTP